MLEASAKYLIMDCNYETKNTTAVGSLTDILKILFVIINLRL